MSWMPCCCGCSYASGVSKTAASSDLELFAEVGGQANAIAYATIGAGEWYGKTFTLHLGADASGDGGWWAEIQFVASTDTCFNVKLYDVSGMLKEWSGEFEGFSTDPFTVSLSLCHLDGVLVLQVNALSLLQFDAITAESPAGYYAGLQSPEGTDYVYSYAKSGEGCATCPTATCDPESTCGQTVDGNDTDATLAVNATGGAWYDTSGSLTLGGFDASLSSFPGGGGASRVFRVTSCASITLTAAADGDAGMFPSFDVTMTLTAVCVPGQTGTVSLIVSVNGGGDTLPASRANSITLRPGFYKIAVSMSGGDGVTSTSATVGGSAEEVSPCA